MTDLLSRLGLSPTNPCAWAGPALAGGYDGTVASYNPADGSVIAEVELATTAQYEQVMATADRSVAACLRSPSPTPSTAMSSGSRRNWRVHRIGGWK